MKYIKNLLFSFLLLLGALNSVEHRTTHLNQLQASQEISEVSFSSQPKEKQVERTVYITKTGSKYHSAGCHYLKSIISIEINKAREAGYAPCKVCRPG